MDNRKQFFEREAIIFQVAESLLLDSADGDLTLDDLAKNLEIAKGTLYKHFNSKDELYLKLLINYEKELLANTKSNESASAILARMVLISLLNPRKTMLYHWLEERLSANAVGQKPLFDELYHARRARMKYLLTIAKTYLTQIDSSMTETEYLSSLWAIGQGGASLLNSSFYQRYLGSREQKIWAWLRQALSLPKGRTDQDAMMLGAKMPIMGDFVNSPLPNDDNVQTNDTAKLAPKKVKKMGIYYDEFSPFGKLMPPSL